MRNLEDVRTGFAVLENGTHLQTAAMLFDPGEASGPLANEHPQSEQVLFVAKGTVEAEIGERRFTMKSGDSGSSRPTRRTASPIVRASAP